MNFGQDQGSPSARGICGRFFAWLPVWVWAFLLSECAALANPIDWPTLGFSQVGTSSFSYPVSIAHAGDGSGRLFIVEQQGRIQILQGTNKLATPFMDISSRIVVEGAEQGLLGLAFPPGFATSQYFYVSYTRATDGALMISRFYVSTANPNVADPTSEQIILVIPKPYDNHNGGQLAFGPDGYLYIGVGDGGSEGDPLNYGQTTDTLLGKILRIDVESGASPYAVPANNPFVGNTNYAPEIWALGLRNPWRFSFDDLTGDLYIGDVGQNLFEEIDYQPAGSAGGQNYGWRIMEGPATYNVPTGFTNFSTLTPPVAWYSHWALPTDVAAAVIGGYVYRGPNAPRMNGMYFYGDYVAGWIWGMKQSGSNWQSLPLNTAGPTYSMSTFGEDDSGNIYLAAYAQGKIYQLQDSLQAWTPTFSASNNIINSDSVMVSCLSTGAVIHYTGDGIDPTESDPAVAAGGTIAVTTGITYKIRAYRPDLTPSGVAAASFTAQVGTPIFFPPAGPITNQTPVSIATVTPNAVIYYTTNGTTPTTSSHVYSKPVTLSGGATLEAMGVAAGYANSVVGSASYSTTLTATPLFSPAAGPITNKTKVSITIATPKAVIHYTTNGKTPTAGSPVYSRPLTLSGGATLKAIGIASGYSNSVVASAAYAAAQTASLIFTPPPGPITNGTPLVIACATPGSTIYYATNESFPTHKSTVYSRPLIINGDAIISAFASTKGYVDGSVQTVFFPLAQTALPAFNPGSGPITNGTITTISCVTTGAKIYYTLDGTIPTTNSSLYTGPITINGGITLQAMAVAGGHLDSPVQSTFFTLSDYKYPTVVMTVAGNGQAGTSNGVGVSATFNSPQGICLDASGNLYVADTGNALIRKISPSGMVTTVASNGLSSPIGICADPAGNLYVADSGDRQILKVDPAGNVSALAGNGVDGYQDGAPGGAEFENLCFLTGDSHTNLYVGDWSRVRTIAADGTVGTLAGSGINTTTDLGGEIGLSADGSNDVYAATDWGLVFEILPSGTQTLFAGGTAGYNDGPRWQASFAEISPGPSRDTAVDNAGNVYISDGAMVRKIDTNGWVSTLAGSTQTGFVNGTGRAALFGNVAGMCVDTNGNVYVVDRGNNCIRKISPDTAGIGIADDWQIKYFGHIGIDPKADPDHDGMSNFAEFWSGTDPLDSTSFFAIKSLVIVAGGQAQIQWRTVAEKAYTVQYSDDLRTWQALGGTVAGNGAIASVTDSATMEQAPHRTYRVYLAY